MKWSGKHYYAHRIAAWLCGVVKSPSAPKRKNTSGFVLHSCDNRKCCNPAHFFVGTANDNIQDMVKKGRNGGVKLSAAAVAEVRRLCATGLVQRRIAERFGVSPALVCLIFSGGRR